MPLSEGIFLHEGKKMAILDIKEKAFATLGLFFITYFSIQLITLLSLVIVLSAKNITSLFLTIKSIIRIISQTTIAAFCAG